MGDIEVRPGERISAWISDGVFGTSRATFVGAPDPAPLARLGAAARENALVHGYDASITPFGTLIALVHSEASEALEADREDDWGYGHEYSMTSALAARVVDPDTMAAMASLQRFMGRGYMSHDEPPPPPTDAENVLLRKAGMAKPVGVPSELADIIIRVLDIAAARGVDIDRAVREKMEYNVTRPYKHGKKAY